MVYRENVIITLSPM